jgi:outer membrane receptor protein involved in Fe transport
MKTRTKVRTKTGLCLDRLWRAGLVVALTVLGCVGGAAAVHAQVTTADLVGRVTDSSGGALPGATVVVTNPATGDQREQVTGSMGDYVFSLLPIGRYTLRVELQGFTPFGANVQLSAGDRQRVDAPLAVGAITETILVTAEAPIIQTDSATVGALLPETAVQDLPLNGRNVIGLVRLVPGANEGLPSSLSSGNRPDDRRQSSTVSVNGQNDVLNNNLIDGVDNNERYIGTIGVRPSVDAIAEVKVQTNMYTAETGRTAGAVVNILTKSGSNEFRGSGYGFFRNERFDSYDYFARRDQVKPRLRQQQWGASLGGPIVKNRTFFFADYERFHQVRGQTFVSTVPTAAMRSGDFSELLAARGIAIYDPLAATRTPFPGNVIPAGRIDPVAQRFLNLYPVPSAAGLGSNFTTSVNREQTSDTFDARLDHRFSSDRSLYVQYSDNAVETLVPGVFGLVNGIDPGGSAAGFGGPSIANAWGLHANFLEILKPNLLFEVKAGKLFFDTQSLPETFGQNVATSFGLQGINVDERTSGLPNFAVAGYTTLGDPRFVPILLTNNTWQAQAALTNTRGAHTLRAGVGLVRRSFEPIQSNDGTGLYTFTAAPTNNGAGVGGDAVASFLLGYPFTVARAHLVVDTTLQTWEPSVFFQDDWRATEWLTLNLGLRYDVFTPFTEADGEISNIDPTTLQFLIPGQNGASDTAGVKTDYGNLAPRLGFAATVRPGMVVRGGYGISYFPSSMASNAVLRNTPFTFTYAATSAAGSGGVPTVFFSTPLPTPALGSASAAGTITAVDTNLKSSYLHQYNLMLEKELVGSSVTVGYVGSKGRRLWMAVPNLNYAAPGAGAVNPRRPYVSVAPNLTTLGLLQSAGQQDYNALQMAFARRSRGGLTLSANYTLAKGMSDVTQPGGGGAQQAYGVLPGQIHELEWSPSDIDIRHRYAFSANYELPFGRSTSGPVKHLVADWQVNVLAYWQSGLPFTVFNTTARSNTGAATDRPDQTCSGALADATVTRWFDTSCFVGQAVNTVGNSGRNNLYGPPQRRIDMSFFKDVPVGADRLQLRLEVFNLTNTASFSVPDGGLGSATFGRITSTGNNIPRQFQFAAKYLF